MLGRAIHLCWLLCCAVPARSLQTSAGAGIEDWPDQLTYCAVRRGRSLPGNPECGGSLGDHEKNITGARWRTLFDPKPLPHEGAAKLDGLVVADTQAPPEYSISYPVHDHGPLLSETLMSMLLTTCGSYEVVITLDNCADDSKTRVWDSIASYLDMRRGRALSRRAESFDSLTAPCSGLLTRVVVLESETDLFETAADNLAMSIASPSGYYILVQADLKLYQHGWNVHMSLPARLDSGVLGVSGRCGHAFPECGGSRHGQAGDCMNAARRSEKLELWPKRFSFQAADIVVRSPLLLRASYMQHLQFFDQIHFRLGLDDWNLCRRGWIAGWRVGVQSVDVQDLRDKLHRKKVPPSGRKKLSRIVEKEWRAREKRAPATPLRRARNASTGECPHHDVVSWAAGDADLDRMIADEVARDISKHAPH